MVVKKKRPGPSRRQPVRKQYTVHLVAAVQAKGRKRAERLGLTFSQYVESLIKGGGRG